MTNEIKVKRKLTEMRVHLSDKFLRGAAPKNADGKPKGSVGDDGIIGLRAHYWSGGTIAFYYHYSDKRNPHKRYKEKLGIFPTINVVQARNRAKVIAVKVMEEKSLSQIKRAMRTELNVTELYEEYEKGSLKAPRYKKTTIGKWDTMRRVWIERDTKDPVIRAMFAKSKVDIGSMKL